MKQPTRINLARLAANQVMSKSKRKRIAAKCNQGRIQGKRYSWQNKWPTVQAYKEYFCKEGAYKVNTPAEMIARAKAVSKGDLLVPDVKVCCVDKKPVSCGSL